MSISELSHSSGQSGDRRDRILLFSYAFPPLRVQMTAPVVKAMSGLVSHGFEVDVLCAESFSPFLEYDECLLPYAERHFSDIRRIKPPGDMVTRFRQFHHLIAQMPDHMGVMHRASFGALMDMDLQAYRAVFTWSPFHSINPVMARVKRYRSGVRWIAQFSDPWARNPLEKNAVNRFWSRWHEPRAIKHMDYIVHSSAFARDLMVADQPPEIRAKTAVVPHAFDLDLYPKRSKANNAKFTISYVGVLFDRRSPEPLFRALASLVEKRPEYQNRIQLDLIGSVPDSMLETATARALPDGMVNHVASVSYIQSLERMYDADLLVLIEADTKLNLFVPSKLFDYMGTGRPIIGLAPPGGSAEVLKRLECGYASPSDIEKITRLLEDAIDKLASGECGFNGNEKYRLSHDNKRVAERFIEIMDRI